MSHLSLTKKHGLIPLIHASDVYDVSSLGRRVGHFLDLMEQVGTIDLVDELFVLCNAVHFHDIEILSKLGAGERLDAADCAMIRTHLDHDAVGVVSAL